MGLVKPALTGFVRISGNPEADFKEIEPLLKYGWFHLKLYSHFQDLNRFFVDFRRGLN